MRATCLCGGIEIEIAGKVGPVVYCHCTRCQKASGTAFAANADVRRKYWTWISGEELVEEFPSSEGVFRAFCRRCGSPIYSRRTAQPDSLRIRLGLLDDDPGRRSLAHFGVGSRAAWYEFSDALPQFELGPADQAGEIEQRLGTK